MFQLNNKTDDNQIKQETGETNEFGLKALFLASIREAWRTKIARSFCGFIIAKGVEVIIENNKEAEEWINEVLFDNYAQERLWFPLLYNMSAHGQIAFIISGILKPKISIGLGYLPTSNYGDLVRLSVNHSPIRIGGAHQFLIETYFKGGIKRTAGLITTDAKGNESIDKTGGSVRDVSNGMGFSNLRTNVNFKNKDLISCIHFLNIVDSNSILNDLRKPDIEIDGVDQLILQYGQLEWQIIKETEMNRTFMTTDGQGVIYSGSSVLEGAITGSAQTKRSGVKEAIDDGIVVIDQPGVDPSTKQPFNFNMVQSKPVYNLIQAQKQEIGNEIFRIVGLKLETQTTKKAQISTLEFTSDSLETNLLDMKIEYIKRKAKEAVRKIGLYGIEIGKGFDIPMKDIEIKFPSIDKSEKIIEDLQSDPNPEDQNNPSDPNNNEEESGDE